MRVFLAAALCLAVKAVGHESHIPPLVVHHTETNDFCRFRNFFQVYAPGKQLYYFDEDLCACVYDESVLEEDIPHTHPFEGCVQSPLEPHDCFMPCQVEAIRDHGLGPRCAAVRENLPYDYRLADKWSLNHDHGIGASLD